MGQRFLDEESLEDMIEPVYGSRMKLVAGVALVLVFGVAGCLNTDRNESVTFSNEGVKAYGSKQWDTAIDRFQKAVDRWKDNHQAWNGLGGAHAAKKDWEKAVVAAEQAVEKEPSIAMYHQILGYYLMENEIQTVTKRQADKASKKVEEIAVDLSAANFEKAKTHLEEAVKLNPDLWRSYYLLGRIHRYAGKPKEAAAAFSKSLELGAFEPAPWIALAELYRSWDYTDLAIKIAEQGLKAIPADNEKSDLYFELGMGYDEKRNNDQAIENFEKALESKKDNHVAKFMRGQAYYRKGETLSGAERDQIYAKAKRDLEEFSKAGSTTREFLKQQSSRMLMDMVAKSAGQAGGTPGQKLSPQGLVDKAKKPK